MEEKEPFLDAIVRKERQHLQTYIRKLSAGCAGQNYARIRRVIEEIERTDLPEADKELMREEGIYRKFVSVRERRKWRFSCRNCQSVWT